MATDAREAFDEQVPTVSLGAFAEAIVVDEPVLIAAATPVAAGPPPPAQAEGPPDAGVDAPRREPKLPARADPAAPELLALAELASAQGVSDARLLSFAKSRYRAGRVSVERTDRSFVLKAGDGTALTEAEFSRRFTAVTGKAELRRLEAPHHATWFWAGVVAGGGGTGLALVAIICELSPCMRPDRSAVFSWHEGMTLLGIGSGILAAGATIATIAWNSRDGSPEMHRLDEFEALPLTDRYNEALMQKTLEDIKRGSKPSGVGMKLFVSPAGVALAGTFD